MLSSTKFISNNLTDTSLVARDLAYSISDPLTILLKGEMGSGKTSFAREFIRCFSLDSFITSPTFNLLNIYPTDIHSISLNNSCKEIYHYDLYRIQSVFELDELNLNFALNHSLFLIEWPQIVADRIKTKFIDYRSIL